MEEVPRRTSLAPLASPCFVLRLIGVETEGFLDYQGRAGDHLHCAVEPSPGHIRCRKVILLTMPFRVLLPKNVLSMIPSGQAPCDSNHHRGGITQLVLTVLVFWSRNPGAVTVVAGRPISIDPYWSSSWENREATLVTWTFEIFHDQRNTFVASNVSPLSPVKYMRHSQQDAQRFCWCLSQCFWSSYSD